MKAYSLALVLRETTGIRTEVYSEGGAEYLKVTSPLDAEQLDKLQGSVGLLGWEVVYRAFAHERFLAIVPEKGVERTR